MAESLTFDFARKYNLDIKVARIFNSYGPRIKPNDGRVISNFISQALTNKPFTIYGNGKQTISFCFIKDLIDGLIKLMNSKYTGPINIGNPEECNILELAKIINDKAGFIQLSLSDITVMQRDFLLSRIKFLNLFLRLSIFISSFLNGFIFDW